MDKERQDFIDLVLISTSMDRGMNWRFAKSEIERYEILVSQYDYAEALWEYRKKRINQRPENSGR